MWKRPEKADYRPARATPWWSLSSSTVTKSVDPERRWEETTIGQSLCCGQLPPPKVTSIGQSLCCGQRPPPKVTSIGQSLCCGQRPPPKVTSIGQSLCCGQRPSPKVTSIGDRGAGR